MAWVGWSKGGFYRKLRKMFRFQHYHAIFIDLTKAGRPGPRITYPEDKTKILPYENGHSKITEIKTLKMTLKSPPICLSRKLALF